ncbi:MAG: hypothetical protein JOZ77_12325 [Candidatus Eremiobacteraeota bacterium]|nr:hypothetical protein [Candidatus Eremiobacteraeota bacterium]
MLIAAALAFQLIFRYQYLQIDGALWRLDRVTQQMCEMNVGGVRCQVSSPSTSVSTSTTTSTSTSTSTSLKARVNHK